MSEPLIIDLFAGGGGASTGIEVALGRAPDVAINHDPVAIAMHQVNHSETEHYCNDIWAVDPMSVRDLAWVVVDWAEKRKPDVICIENVEEFRTWGPLDAEGNVIPEFSGQTFEDWLSRLRKAGYKVDWRESRAYSYGAPTIRKRLCIIASRLGRPVWPKPTHGDPKSENFKPSRLLPWRTAAEDVIDWSIACPSIFDSKQAIWERYGLRAVRPLAHNTGARVARGIKRYVLEAERPFLVTLTHGARLEDAAEPMRTVTGANRGEKAVVVPSLTKFNSGSTGSDIDEPAPTITANSFIKRPGGAAPIGLVAPVLSYAQQGGSSRPIGEPAHTICASTKDQNQVIVPCLAQTGYGEREGQAPRALDPHVPLGTVVAGAAKHAPIACFIAQHNTDRAGRLNPGREANAPLSTVTATGSQQGVVAVHVTRQFGASIGHPADNPTGSITAGVNKTGVVAAHMMTMKGSDRRASAAKEPIRGICAGGTHEAVVTGALVKYYGTGDGQSLDDSLHTVTVKDRFGFAQAALSAPPFGPEHEDRAREVADFLRAHGEWDDREFVTLEISGITYVITDIGLRMLTPRELFNAQGFPPDYKIDRDAEGNIFSKSNQVGRAGNSVSPPWAAAHVRANCGHLMQAAKLEAAE